MCQTRCQWTPLSDAETKDATVVDISHNHILSSRQQSRFRYSCGENHRICHHLKCLDIVVEKTTGTAIICTQSTCHLHIWSVLNFLSSSPAFVLPSYLAFMPCKLNSQQKTTPLFFFLNKHMWVKHINSKTDYYYLFGAKYCLSLEKHKFASILFIVLSSFSFSFF